MAGSEGLIYWGALGIILISIIFLIFSVTQISEKLDYVKDLSKKNSESIREIQRGYSKLLKGYETLESSLDRFSYESSRNFDLLNSEISKLGERLESMSLDVENLKENLESVRKREDESEISIGGLKDYIGNLDGKISDVQEILPKFESSLESLERKVDSNSARIADLNSMSTDLKESLEKLEENKIASVDDEIRELKREMNSLFRMVDIGGKDPIVSPFVVLIVEKGDTILKISKAFGVSMGSILDLNGISDPRKLMVGDKIKIPVSLKDVITLPVENLKRGELVKGMDESGWIRFKVNGDFRAVMPGRVEEVRRGYLRLYHGNDVYTSYRFDGDVYVREGDWVRSGQALGKCFGYLDFALMINNEPRDPFKYIFDRVGEFSATFYTEWEDGILPEQASFRVTRSGNLVRKWWTVAADPSVIPLGSYVYIPQLSRMPGGGIFHVEDVGSAIKNRRIDIYVGDMLLALKLWKKDVTVYVMRAGR